MSFDIIKVIKDRWDERLNVTSVETTRPISDSEKLILRAIEKTQPTGGGVMTGGAILNAMGKRATSENLAVLAKHITNLFSVFAAIVVEVDADTEIKKVAPVLPCEVLRGFREDGTIGFVEVRVFENNIKHLIDFWDAQDRETRNSMRVYRCDACGVEVRGANVVTTARRSDKGEVNRYELCDFCFGKVARYVDAIVSKGDVNNG